MFSLKNKKILLTGATGGIGRGIAELFADLGAELCLTGRRLEILEEIKESRPNSQIHLLQFDLSDPAQSNDLINRAEDAFGAGVEVVICNAGINADNLALRLDDDAWQRVIDTNLTANFRINRAAIKNMLRRKIPGSIINISSVVAHTGNSGQTNYTASKAGLEGMSRSFALEVASRGIRVNCIAPGFITSPMTEALEPAQVAAISGKIPLKRLGSPADVAAAAAFLAADESAYMTGTVLHVNGGLYMG